MTSLLDERGRLFGKVNIVDLIVVVLLLILIALAAVRLLRPEGEPVPILTTFTVEHVQEPTVQQFMVVGRQVSDDTGTVLGKIAKPPEVKESKVEYPDSRGQAQESDSPIFRDVIVDVKGDGRVSKDSISIGGVNLAVGKILTIKGPGFETKAKVTGVHAAKGR